MKLEKKTKTEPAAEVVEAEKVEEEKKREGSEGAKGPVTTIMRERRPREFQIMKGDGERFGYTRGCGGCTSWFKGVGRQGHTEACGDRFRGLKEEARVKSAAGRKKEFEEKELEKRRRKEEKRKRRRKTEQRREVN